MWPYRWRACFPSLCVARRGHTSTFCPTGYRKSDTCTSRLGPEEVYPPLPLSIIGWSRHDGGKQGSMYDHQMEPTVDRDNKTEAAGSLALWSCHVCPGQLVLWLSKQERKNKFILFKATYFGLCHRSKTCILINTLTRIQQLFLASKG